MSVSGENKNTVYAESNTLCADELSAVSVAMPKSRMYLFFKRLCDIVISALSLVLLSPFLIITALIIVIDDPQGGPIFTQMRCGKNGKPFKFYKFRTMCVNAEKELDALMDKNEVEGPAFKIENDPRLTRFGKLIRKISLDETPQLLNVLKGDMSLVGPRPPLPREVAQYTEHQKQRLSVTPGLTCYWQISNRRNKMPFDQWVELDLKYIRERSIGVDAGIILKTFRAVFTAQGE